MDSFDPPATGMEPHPSLSVVEICAGAGGQALGLEAAGFSHASAVEIESAACETLTRNRPDWNVQMRDVRSLSGRDFRGIDLLAGGVPCPPFSIAGRQLGGDDERPDIVFSGARVVVFVDGDFWHARAIQERGPDAYWRGFRSSGSRPLCTSGNW